MNLKQLAWLVQRLLQMLHEAQKHSAQENCAECEQLLVLLTVQAQLAIPANQDDI